MIALAAIAYIALIAVCYKAFRIKPNSVNVGLFTALGVVVLGIILVLWKFSSPSSTHLMVSRYTVPIVPQVKGPISKIVAQPNVPLRQGKDVLFEIQKDVFEFNLRQAQGALKSAETNLGLLQAAIRVAEANVRKLQASLAASEAELSAAQETQKINAGAIAKIKVKQLTEANNAAAAAVDQAIASKEQAEQALQVAGAQIVSLKAAEDAAQFNLKQCTVYAPADGFVTQWTAREGTMTDTSSASPVGTFIDTTHTFLLATFPQNVLSNVKPGDPVEMTFKTEPGKVFTGTVQNIIEATGEGQISPSGKLLSPVDWGSSGLCFVRFQADEQEVVNRLALGTDGTVSIYTDKGKPFHIISKVSARINAWMYYLKPF